MSRQNWEDWEKKIEKKQAQRVQKNKPRMKVSGAKVKQLQRIIKNK